MKITSCLMSVCGWLFIAQGAVAAEKDEIVATCRDGYLQARAAIRTLSCTVEINTSAWRGPNPFSGKIENFPATVQRLRFVEDRGVALGKLTSDPSDIVEDYLWDKGTLKHLTTHKPNGEKSLVGRLNGPDGIRGMTTAWLMALMDRPEEFQRVMNEGRVSEAVIDEIQGQKCYRLSIYKDSWRKDVWFDIKKNFLVRKTVFYPKGDAGPPNQTNEVAQFIESKPGIFFPVSVKGTMARFENQNEYVTTTFRDVKINEPVDPAQLELQFPPGTKVTDTRNGTYYIVDENEQPVGEVETLPKREIQLPTGLEPKSYRIYWVAGVVAVGILGVLVAVYMRRRAHAS